MTCPDCQAAAANPRHAGYRAECRGCAVRAMANSPLFFDAARITAVRQMILADDEKGRRVALDKLLPEQRKDFAAIFEVMAGLPVTIRLLDPPLHEFLPHSREGLRELAEALDRPLSEVTRRADMGDKSLFKALNENGNPTLDTVHKVLHAVGLRLSVVPELAH